MTKPNAKKPLKNSKQKKTAKPFKLKKIVKPAPPLKKDCVKEASKHQNNYAFISTIPLMDAYEENEAERQVGRTSQPFKLKKIVKPAPPLKKALKNSKPKKVVKPASPFKITKLKHSPEPWAISQPSGNDGEAEVIVDAKGRIIAWTATSYHKKTQEEFISPEDKSNGFLIANAPTLLAALEKIVRIGGSKPTAELAIAKEALSKLKQ